jgi:hypothetical protein
LSFHPDIPCNTQIMFRIVQDRLDMTVINRSNDLIWGMLGANAVHMTYLHELMARWIGRSMGYYKVFTNNLHVYKNLEKFEDIWNTVVRHDYYANGSAEALPLLQPSEKPEELLADCTDYIRGGAKIFRTRWMYDVVMPMHSAYTERKNKTGDGSFWVERIRASDWRLACEQWLIRKTRSSSTSTEPSPTTGTETT